MTNTATLKSAAAVASSIISVVTYLASGALFIGIFIYYAVNAPAMLFFAPVALLIGIVGVVVAYPFAVLAWFALAGLGVLLGYWGESS